MFAGASALIVAAWIAICGAAPEFIWQGLRIALSHPSWADLASALLIGLVLAFFVEPAIESIRVALHRTPHDGSTDSRRRNALFTAGLGLAFALTSVCLHDAMTSFVSGRSAEHAGADSGLAAGVMLVTAWSIVPFAVALAWLSMRQGWFAIPMGIIAGASSCLAGWLFVWSTQAVITTTIPCLAILALGYRQLLRHPGRRGLTHCAHGVALVAAVWLAIALLADAVLAFSHFDRFGLYNASRFWMDVRFYLGWTLGLMLVPSPYGQPAARPD
jgi:hypothetical protein